MSESCSTTIPTTMPDFTPYGPPCKHNNWNNARVKKNTVTLRCRDCAIQWKLRYPVAVLCAEFHTNDGVCALGTSCPFLHVHRYKCEERCPNPPGYVIGTERDEIVYRIAVEVFEKSAPGTLPADVVDDIMARALPEQQRKSGGRFYGSNANVLASVPCGDENDPACCPPPSYWSSQNFNCLAPPVGDKKGPSSSPAEVTCTNPCCTYPGCAGHASSSGSSTAESYGEYGYSSYGYGAYSYGYNYGPYGYNYGASPSSDSSAPPPASGASYYGSEHSSWYSYQNPLTSEYESAEANTAEQEAQ